MPTSRRPLGATLAAAAVLATTAAWGAPDAAAVSDADAASHVTAELKTMSNVWWYEAMRLDKVHGVATGKGVKVAVIDGYLDPTVPDLRGAKISKGDSCRGNPVPFLSGELASHGTAMTTAIVGQGANGRGIVGVAPDAELRFYSFDDDPNQSLVECDAILIQNQIEKAIAWGADVISMSIGTGGGLEGSIEEAWDAGAVVVAASGAREADNERAVEAIQNPAAMAGVVAVAAAGSDGKVWSENPYSFEPDDIYLTLAAPGVDVPIGGFPEGSREWLAGGVRTGTSPATAITAGAFAVLKSRWPEATNNQLIQAFIHTASGESQRGKLRYDKAQGYGLLKLRGALDEDPTGWPDENPLLVPPREAKLLYPASSYDLDRGENDGASSPSASTGARPARSDTAATEDDDGTALTLLVGGGVLLAAVAAAGVLFARRRQTT